MPADWNDHELALIVSDYFDVLGWELRGESYNKAAHNRRLAMSLHEICLPGL